MVSQLSSGKKGDRASFADIAIELNNFVTLLYKTRKKIRRSSLRYKMYSLKQNGLPPHRPSVYTQVESELVSIRAEWTQTVAARVLR